jgi:hypothetical protein
VTPGSISLLAGESAPRTPPVARNKSGKTTRFPNNPPSIATLERIPK